MIAFLSILLGDAILIALTIGFFVYGKRQWRAPFLLPSFCLMVIHVCLLTSFLIVGICALIFHQMFLHDAVTEVVPDVLLRSTETVVRDNVEFVIERDNSEEKQFWSCVLLVVVAIADITAAFVGRAIWDEYVLIYNSFYLPKPVDAAAENI